MILEYIFFKEEYIVVQSLECICLLVNVIEIVYFLYVIDINCYLIGILLL